MIQPEMIETVVDRYFTSNDRQKIVLMALRDRLRADLVAVDFALSAVPATVDQVAAPTTPAVTQLQTRQPAIGQNSAFRSNAAFEACKQVGVRGPFNAVDVLNWLRRNQGQLAWEQTSISLILKELSQADRIGLVTRGRGRQISTYSLAIAPRESHPDAKGGGEDPRETFSDEEHGDRYGSQSLEGVSDVS